MRGSSIKRLPYDPDDPSPQPAFYPPLMPSGHADLAREITRAADFPQHCPAERLRGMCEAYVAVAGLSTIVRDEHDVAEVIARAREDVAAHDAAVEQIGRPGLDYYLRLTQQQEEAEQRMEELTRLRGHALGEYRRQTGASLRQVAAAIRQAGYAISPTGVSWLVHNSAPES
jgi:hypothetical protein